MKQTIQLTNPVKKVMLIKNVNRISRGIFDVSGFTDGKIYDVRGVSQKRYSDGETLACYLIIDNEGVMRETAIDRFKVIE